MANSVYYVSGIVLSALCSLTYVILSKLCEVGVTVSPFR